MEEVAAEDGEKDQPQIHGLLKVNAKVTLCKLINRDSAGYRQ